MLQCFQPATARARVCLLRSVTHSSLLSSKSSHSKTSHWTPTWLCAPSPCSAWGSECSTMDESIADKGWLRTVSLAVWPSLSKGFPKPHWKKATINFLNSPLAHVRKRKCSHTFLQWDTPGAAAVQQLIPWSKVSKITTKGCWCNNLYSKNLIGSMHTSVLILGGCEARWPKVPNASSYT